MEKLNLSDYHKENMRIHISFLRNTVLPKFTMSMYMHPCGTSACSLGHAPKSLMVDWDMSEERSGDFSFKVFGVHSITTPITWCYMFGGMWVYVNDSPQAAAARMEAVLYNQIPEEFYPLYREVMLFSKAEGMDEIYAPLRNVAHPIVIVPEIEACGPPPKKKKQVVEKPKEKVLEPA